MHEKANMCGAQILRILDALGVDATIDNVSASIVTCPLRPDGVTVLTSPAAIRAHDPRHPERIDSILVRGSGNVINYRVMVNDRDIDIEKAVPFWLNADPLPSKRTECAVCLTRQKEFVRCSHCFTMLCVKCHDKITWEGTHHCPVCRQWTLDGGDFGVPWDASTHMVLPIAQLHPIDVFGQVLDRLDGRMSIFLRVDNTFIVDDSLLVVKLARTHRYTEDSSRIKDVRKRLRKLCTMHLARTSDVMLWLIRTTYKVTDRPVQEVSIFRVTKTELQQYGRDAWINILDELDVQAVRMVKTEYLPPHRHVLPEYVAAVLADVNTCLCEKTVSISKRSHERSMNFDIDASGAITTMHADMLAAYFDVISAPGEKLYLLCHMHNKEIMVYELDPDARVATRLTTDATKEIVGMNLDGLGTTLIASRV